MATNNNKNHPVDAVITWVDGNDISWQKKINGFLPKKINWANKKETGRFDSINEIEFAIRSIVKFASFIQNIYLVTDNQTPNNFKQLQTLSSKAGINITIVDHSILFKGYEHCLPTFNPRSIGTVLHRIPNLSEHFIFFNDDMILIRETKLNDFFIDGKPVIRAKWDKYYEDQTIREFYHQLLSIFGKTQNKTRAGHKKAQQISARIVNSKKYLKGDHTPDPIRKSTIQEFFMQNPSLFKNNIKHKFRNSSQFLITYLSYNLETKLKNYPLNRNLQLGYFQSYKSFNIIKLKLFWFSRNHSTLFICFQNLERANQKELNYIRNWIEKRLR